MHFPLIWVINDAVIPNRNYGVLSFFATGKLVVVSLGKKGAEDLNALLEGGQVVGNLVLVAPDLVG